MRRAFDVRLVGLLAALLLAIAAGCGGDDEEGAGDTSTGGGGAESVSGSVTILADWTGPEGESFKAVLDGFREKYPNVDAKCLIRPNRTDFSLLQHPQ